MKGIDLSRHNFDRGPVDYAAVLAAGYEFVVLKLTEGVDYIDPYVMDEAKRVKDAGLLLSYYHFATPGGSKVSGGYKKWWDAQDEAEDFLAALSRAEKPDFRITLDYEWSSDHIEETLPNKPDRTRWAAEWVTFVQKALGYWPIFYTYKHYLDDQLTTPNATLQKCPLWYARYNDTPGLDPAWGWDEYLMWQSTSHGSVPGIVGRVDLNDAPNGLKDVMFPPPGQPLADQIRMHTEAIRAHCDALDKIAGKLGKE